MLRYQQAMDVQAHRYTAEEALQSLHSAYQRPPRQAWERRCALVAPPPDHAARFAEFARSRHLASRCQVAAAGPPLRPPPAPARRWSPGG
jgi:hypothetical protein